MTHNLNSDQKNKLIELVNDIKKEAEEEDQANH